MSHLLLLLQSASPACIWIANAVIQQDLDSHDVSGFLIQASINLRTKITRPMCHDSYRNLCLPPRPPTAASVPNCPTTNTNARCYRESYVSLRPKSEHAVHQWKYNVIVTEPPRSPCIAQQHTGRDPIHPGRMESPHPSSHSSTRTKRDPIHPRRSHPPCTAQHYTESDPIHQPWESRPILNRKAAVHN